MPEKNITQVGLKDDIWSTGDDCQEPLTPVDRQVKCA